MKSHKWTEEGTKTSTNHDKRGIHQSNTQQSTNGREEEEKDEEEVAMVS